MSNKEILEKAIQKAIDGGWDETQANFLKDLADNKAVYWGWVKNGFIFDHDFAKALWGEVKHLTNDQVYLQEMWSSRDNLSYDGEPWQYHLQQMVIADDPIKYLGANI